MAWILSFLTFSYVFEKFNRIGKPKKLQVDCEMKVTNFKMNTVEVDKLEINPGWNNKGLNSSDIFD